MPNTRNSKLVKRNLNGDACKKSVANVNTTELNLNSNHVASEKPANIERKRRKTAKKKTKLYSEVQNLSERLTECNNDQTVEFVEDRDVIQMEINDSGAAVAEFASEEDTEMTMPQTDSDCDGEITDSDSERQEDSQTETQTASDTYSEAEENDSPVKDKGRKKKHKVKHRRSVEEKLDNLSNTLLAMKDIFHTTGFYGWVSEGQEERMKGQTR